MKVVYISVRSLPAWKPSSTGARGGSDGISVLRHLDDTRAHVGIFVDVPVGKLPIFKADRHDRRNAESENEGRNDGQELVHVPSRSGWGNDGPASSVAEVARVRQSAAR